MAALSPQFPYKLQKDNNVTEHKLDNRNEMDQERFIHEIVSINFKIR